MVVYVGDDWAEDHHDVHLMDESGERLAARRLPEGVAASPRCTRWSRQHAAGPGEVVIGIETDRGPWVSALGRGRLPRLRHQPALGVALP